MITVSEFCKTGCHSKKSHINDRHTNINLHLDLANHFLYPSKLVKQNPSRSQVTETSKGRRGKVQWRASPTQCPQPLVLLATKTTWSWQWGHREEQCAVTRGHTTTSFSSTETSTASRSPKLLKYVDPISNCCASLAKITGRVSHCVCPKCSAS